MLLRIFESKKICILISSFNLSNNFTWKQAQTICTTNDILRLERNSRLVFSDWRNRLLFENNTGCARSRQGQLFRDYIINGIRLNNFLQAARRKHLYSLLMHLTRSKFYFNNAPWFIQLRILHETEFQNTYLHRYFI